MHFEGDTVDTRPKILHLEVIQDVVVALLDIEDRVVYVLAKVLLHAFHQVPVAEAVDLVEIDLVASIFLLFVIARTVVPNNSGTAAFVALAIRCLAPVLALGLFDLLDCIRVEIVVSKSLMVPLLDNLHLLSFRCRTDSSVSLIDV